MSSEWIAVAVLAVPRSLPFWCVGGRFLALRRKELQSPPACYRSLSGPSRPKCPESALRGVSGALRAPGSGVSKKCPESVPGVSGIPF